MTNEEKIEEIVIDAYEGWTKVGFTDYEMIAILSKLAEWKDQQFKEYLGNKIKSLKSRGEGFFATEIKTIEEINNELFNKD